MNSFRPIFIVGVGRSGTSMLQSMLNSHKDITFPPETHFIRNYMYKDQNYKLLKTQLMNDEDLLRLEISLETIYQTSKNLNDFFQAVLVAYMKKKNKKMVGDKDPKNIEYLNVIHSIFPNAIVIHIYRDPRAVIASRLKAKWSKDKPFWQHLLAYKSQLFYGRKKGSELFSNYIEIKYENLILDSTKELEELCQFIGIEFDINMMNFYKNASEVVQGEEVSWKENVFRPIMTENIEKWQKELTVKQIKKIESSLSYEMAILGYRPTIKLAFGSKLKISLYNLILTLLSKIYIRNLK